MPPVECLPIFATITCQTILLNDGAWQRRLQESFALSLRGDKKAIQNDWVEPNINITIKLDAQLPSCNLADQLECMLELLDSGTGAMVQCWCLWHIYELLQLIPTNTALMMKYEAAVNRHKLTQVCLASLPIPITFDEGFSIGAIGGPTLRGLLDHIAGYAARAPTRAEVIERLLAYSEQMLQ